MDYGDDADLPPDEDSLKRLVRLAVEMGKLTIERDELAEQVSAMNKRIATYSESLIPTLMDELGLPELKTKSGLIITVKKDVYASFPKDPEKREKAFDYLRETNNDGMIQREVVVELARDSTEDVELLMNFIKTSGIGDRAKSAMNTESINHNTMLAFLRRAIKEVEKKKQDGEDAKDIPLDLFGAFQKTTATLKVSKKD